MPTILVVPDVHEELVKLLRIEQNFFPKVDRIIMLGDMYDKFGRRETLAAAEWVKEHLGDDRITWLWGNHDCSYAFGPLFRCSGYSAESQVVINSVLTTEDWRKFKVSTTVGKFLLSHAGYCEEIIKHAVIMFPDLSSPEVIPALEQQALEAAFSGTKHILWRCGKRCGYPWYGGPTWLDWDLEFKPLAVPQIVGHTFDSKHRVRTKTHTETGNVSYCLDTGLNHVMLIDELSNEVEIVNV